MSVRYWADSYGRVWNRAEHTDVWRGQRQIEDYRLVQGPVSEVKCAEQVDQSARSGSRGPDKRVCVCAKYNSGAYGSH